MSSSKNKRDLIENISRVNSLSRLKKQYLDQKTTYSAECISILKTVQKDKSEFSFKTNIHHESVLNSLVDHIYVINLQKQLNRRIRIIGQFKKMGINYTFIDGVYGLDPKYVDQWEAYQANNAMQNNKHTTQNKIINPGIWGYYQVMINVFTDALKKGYKSILVFDDDVVFNKQFHYITSTLQELIKNKSWLTILLGASEQRWKLYNEEYVRRVGWYTPKRTDGSFAICYNYSSFQFLLHQCQKLVGTYDSNALRALYESYPTQNFVLYPNLVIADVSESTLREDHDMIKSSEKFKWQLSDYDYKSRGELVTILIYIKDQLKNLSTLLLLLLKQDYKEYQIKFLNDCSNKQTTNLLKQIANEFDSVVYSETEYPMGYISTVKNEVDQIEDSNYILVLDAGYNQEIEKDLITQLLYYPLIAKNMKTIFLGDYKSNTAFSTKDQLFKSLTWNTEEVELYNCFRSEGCTVYYSNKN